ncbi:hypothetical protein ACFLZQ_02090 [Thermodesulfobacteriota bacterium]
MKLPTIDSLPLFFLRLLYDEPAAKRRKGQPFTRRFAAGLRLPGVYTPLKGTTRKKTDASESRTPLRGDPPHRFSVLYSVAWLREMAFLTTSLFVII